MLDKKTTLSSKWLEI